MNDQAARRGRVALPSVAFDDELRDLYPPSAEYFVNLTRTTADAQRCRRELVTSSASCQTGSFAGQ